MAAFIESTGEPARRKGFGRSKKHALKTDMTPMVDLGFLLIAFFIFTTEMNKPVVAPLAMPNDKAITTELAASNALTLLLGVDNKMWYYEGNMKDALAGKRIIATNFSFKEGFGKIIRDKQRWLDEHVISKEKRDGLMLLIKATPEASYENVMKALDEALINNVKKYTLIKTANEELEWLKQQQSASYFTTHPK